ncbi:putative 4-hydroxybenzoate polyprenyltransferase [Clostridium sp. CF011]|uniref:UbiA-like polyprenyltransferase n=1 Tax=Clostridium sp. CF011 TaxID=2843318 RepID=UPI001C0CDBCA|nr:UbiA-like polyprenyltransferase [Clostridium sp. CF011]MBU3091984.1 putative 4-hydroxybenzoate polyprenyltransferase [Clostridium sp. CF011]WAG70499.1 putative 4-hydroxybenzoate polyprenyltransferase [Clostridium sp. CF011]
MVLKKLKKYGELVMFSHTLFSLPFALIAMIWAADGLPSGPTIFWILIALIGARNGANALNRIVDKDIDKKNPRTASRHLPKGIVKDHEVWGIIILCFSIFILAAYELNDLCFLLSPVALFLFIIYSYTKRFTWICHIILGITCGGAPVGAWLAVTGKFALTPIILGAVVTLWVAGFDIIYATQDIDFDRKAGLFSIPAKFGLKGALYISTLFHFIMILLLFSLYFIMHTGLIYLFGIFISAILLALEHYIVSPTNEKKMKIASYHINQVVSVLIFVFTVLDMFIYYN